MKNEELFELIGDIDDQFILEASVKPKKQTQLFNQPLWLKGLVSLLCILLILAGFNSLIREPSHPLSLITHYEYNYGTSYIPPKPGEYYCFEDVNAARKENQNDSTFDTILDIHYVLAIDIFKEDEQSITDVELTNEYQRLLNEGYQLYSTKYWTYNEKGNKDYHSIVLCALTDKELNTFKVNMNYGYAFHFITNGDGSPIDSKSLKEYK